MDTSILLARIVGPYCVIGSLGALINRKRLSRVTVEKFRGYGGSAAAVVALALILLAGVWLAYWGLTTEVGQHAALIES